MLKHPRFKPHLQLATIPDEGIFVLSGGRESLLRGALYQLVAPHVDGRSADEICDRLAGQASPAEVYFTLGQLEKKGYLTEVQESLPADDAAWWSLHKIDPAIAARRLAESRVSVYGLGIEVEPLRELLVAAGVRIAPDDGLSPRGKSPAGESSAGEKTVVVVDHYLRHGIEDFNVEALTSGRQWLLVKPLGWQLWLGPLFRPGATGCWKCLADRLRANRAVESYLLDRELLAEGVLVDRVHTKASAQIAWGMTANAIASWIVCGELPDCDGKMQTFDQLSRQTKTHVLTRLPYCTACSQTNLDNRPDGLQPPSSALAVSRPQSNGHAVRKSTANGSSANGPESNGSPSNGPAVGSNLERFRPLVLEGRQKSCSRDGGSRVVRPETTLERYGHHVSPITGAVSMLERTSPPGSGAMHVYLAGSNLARRHRNVGQLQGDLRNMSAGKGTTDAQAKASGLCEGLERYSGVFRGDEPRRRARFGELAGAIDLNECLLFSQRQYRERDKINAKDSQYNFVPVPFDPQSEIDWSPVWSLSRQEVRYVPTAFCFYDYPQVPEERYCIADSNGCAAGNTIEEAILQGFLELVERDSVALWWYNRVSRPGVDLASFDEPYLHDLTECLSAHQRKLCVVDLTSDLGIPVFAAWSQSTAPGPEQIILGFGAHFDARTALLRAVTEMNQMLSYLLQAPLDKGRREHVTDRETVEWLKTATAENQPYLLPNSGVALRTAADYPQMTSDDVAEEVRAAQALIERLGLEMLVLDQTRPEIGLPVVKVIVPGLRHFWARFAPGRLYDVPVRMGWLPQPLAEEDLNPIPMFL
jgi:bacteriocin biosynthesis cyclodehydratase domain-containing protein